MLPEEQIILIASCMKGRWIVQVTILVAILYLVLGALRLGFLCNMLSKPIISAFLTAGAIIISTSQVSSSAYTSAISNTSAALVRLELQLCRHRACVCVIREQCSMYSCPELEGRSIEATFPIPYISQSQDSSISSVMQPQHPGVAHRSCREQSAHSGQVSTSRNCCPHHCILHFLCCAQVKYILGYNIPHVDRIQDLVYNLVANAHKFQWREFVMGVAWIVLLLLIKNAPRYNK